MNIKALTLGFATLLLWLMSTSTALADGPGPIRIGINSQQYGPSRARVAAHIHETSARAGEARDRGHWPGTISRSLTASGFLRIAHRYSLTSLRQPWIGYADSPLRCEEPIVDLRSLLAIALALGLAITALCVSRVVALEPADSARTEIRPIEIGP